MSFVKRFWFWGLVLVIALGVAGYLFLRPSPLKGKAFTVKRGDLKDTMSFSGKVDAGEKATLKFQSSGRLSWIGVKEGDYVKRFQGMASLDREQLKKTMEKYMNTYMKQRNSFENTQSDNKDYQLSGTLTNAQKEAVKRTVQDSQSNLNNSVLDYELQVLAHKDAFLYTPIEGIVTRVDVPNVGVNITPVAAAFEVVNPKTIFFSSLADQTEVVRLKSGMKAVVGLDAFPNQMLEGEVFYVSYAPKDGETNTVYEVKISLPTLNEEMKYRLGMTGDVEFVFEEKKSALFVPSKYIKGIKTKEVYKLVNGKKEKVSIKTGKDFDGSVEVLEGLKEGDVIYDQAN